MYHETKSLFGDAALEEIRRKEESMSTVRIGPNHQVTIPQDVLKKLEVGVGDSLQADVEEGKLVLFPSYVQHSAMLYRGGRDRIVVSFNSRLHARA